MGYNYRCSIRDQCGRRKTLKRNIDFYKYRPLCPGCNKDTLKSVNDKEVDRNKRRGCFCQGRWWPHNKGRIEDENHVCIHAEDPEGQLMAMAIGADTTIMKPEDECPF